MGTTRDALEAGGAVIGFALVIEGYPYIIIDRDDTAAAIAAWAASDWVLALPGLIVTADFDQEIKPWDPRPSAPIVTFSVVPDPTDQFGIDVFRSKPDFQTRLDAPFVATREAGSISVQGTVGLSPTGTVFLGTMAIDYTSLGLGIINFEINSVGKFAPHTTDKSTTFPYPNAGPGPDFDVASNPKLTDAPTLEGWSGRQVGLYVHRIVDGVWDTRAEAELLFAGHIGDIMELDDGGTHVEAIDFRQQIMESMIGKDQLRGFIKEGLYLQVGAQFNARDYVGTARLDADSLNVVASGAVAPNEINEGYHSVPDLMTIFNTWLRAEQVAGRLGAEWSCTIVSDQDQGSRVLIRASFGSTALRVKFVFALFSPYYAQFLGFDSSQVKRSEAIGHYLTDEIPETSVAAGKFPNEVGKNIPMRVQPIQREPDGRYTDRMELEDVVGSWVSLPEFLPPNARTYNTGFDDYGFLKIGEKAIVLTEHVDDSTYLRVLSDDSISSLGVVEEIAELRQGLTLDEPGQIEVRQITVICGSFCEIVASLFASVEGNGVNHEHYDQFPWGARVPWSLLGENFLNSLRALEQCCGSDAMMIMLEKPTKLWDILHGEMMLRFCWLIWKDEGFQFVSPEVPNASTAPVQLSEDNKGAASGDNDAQKTSTRQTDEFMRNNVKILINRTIEDSYEDDIIMKNPVSIDANGERAITIKARNSSAGTHETGESVEALAVSLMARMAPFFVRPMKVWKRSLLGTLWLSATPGASAGMTDNLVRDPTTGRRGLTGRGVTILKRAHNWGHGGSGEQTGDLAGDIEVLFSEEDRTFPYSPTADVDEDHTTGGFVNGWDAGALELRLKPNQYSEAGEPKDVTDFPIGSIVRIFQRDPDASTGSDFFDDETTAENADSVVLLNGFGAGGRPAFDATKVYRLGFATRSQVATPQLLTAYQADLVDGLVEDTIDPNLYGEQGQLDFENTAPTVLPARHVAEVIGEGEPVSSHIPRDLCAMVNNLVSYKTATSQPAYNDAFVPVAAFGGIFKMITVLPFHISEAQIVGGRLRHIEIRLRFRRDAGTFQVRVHAASKLPQIGLGPSAAGNLDVIVAAPSNSVTFRTTNGSFETSERQTLVAPRGLRGHTFLIVEATGEGVLFGFPELKWGPLLMARYPKTRQEFANVSGRTLAQAPESLWILEGEVAVATDLIGAANLDKEGDVLKTTDLQLDGVAAEFEDGGNAMAAASSSELDVTTGSITIYIALNVFVKFLSLPAHLVGKRPDGAGPFPGFSLYMPDINTVRWRVQDSAATVQDEDIDITDRHGERILFVPTYDVTNNVMKLFAYIDGVVIESAGQTAALLSLTNSGEFAFGEHSNTDGATAASYRTTWGAVARGTPAEGVTAAQVLRMGRQIFSP